MDASQFEIQIGKIIYAIAGQWKIQSDQPAVKADLNVLPLSFEDRIITDSVNLIHPDDIKSVSDILSTAAIEHRIDFRFRIITSDRDILLMRITGTLAMSRRPEDKQDANDHRTIIGRSYDDVVGRKLHEFPQRYLFRLSDVLRTTTDAVDIEEKATAIAMEYFEADRCYYCAIENGDVIIKRDARKEGLPSLAGAYPLSNFVPLKSVIEKGVPFVVNDAHTSEILDDPLRQQCLQLQVVSFIDVPVMRSGQVVGIFCIVKSKPRNWTQPEQDLAIETAERVWTAIERAKAEEALRKSEQRFQVITNAALALTWICSAPDGANIYFNDRWYEYTGQTKNEAAGYGWTNAVHPEDWQRLAPYWERCQRTGEVYEGEVRYRRHDGEYCWFAFRALPRKNSDDKIEEWYGLSLDINVTKSAEEVLRKSEEKCRELNARLQETDKLKTAFFNNVSHEFRTPLTLLMSPLEELIKSSKSKLNAEDMIKLQFAYRSATRLQKLVTTLLDFARIEAGKLEAYYQPADFSKTTADLASVFRSAIEKAGLKYIVKAEQIAEPVYLNREMWEKIVFNLLSNAFKFTHKGKIEVIIREKKKHAELRIKDTGVGIASKDIHRIFDRFTRIEGTIARTNEGTGIGLALVRELVAVHGGVIKVKSTEGVGSEFIVSIPKGKSHFAKHQIFENRERQAADDLKESYVEEVLGWLPEDVKTARRNLKRYQKEGASRILIVEDNANMREYLTTVLSEDDYKVFAVKDGQKVITFLEDGGQADLILADVMMPVLDGFEMTKKLKVNPKFTDIPVVLLTAKVSESSRIEGLRVGAAAYVSKPFSAKELRAVVRSALERRCKPKA